MNKEIMHMSNRKTQAEKLFARLNEGTDLTVAEARSKFGVQRLAARIHELRNEGFRIYTNTIKLKRGPNRGKKVTAYRLVPSK